VSLRDRLSDERERVTTAKKSVRIASCNKTWSSGQLTSNKRMAGSSIILASCWVHGSLPLLMALSLNRVISPRASCLLRLPRFSSEAPRTMTSQELVHGCWDKAQVSQAALQSSARMLFGYGSLIWKVDFETVRSFPCYISGFERRFWMKSADHRGTVESPGRVVTLVKGKTETSKVAGRAYEIPPDKFQEIIDQLDVRERHGYTREVAKIVDLAGDEHECLVYYNDPQTGGNAIMWNEEPAQTAQIIAHAVGPLAQT